MVTSFCFKPTAKNPELCSDQNGGCSQTCIQKSKYCLFGKCYFNCHIDFLCTRWVDCKCDPGYKLLANGKDCAGWLNFHCLSEIILCLLYSIQQSLIFAFFFFTCEWNLLSELVLYPFHNDYRHQWVRHWQRILLPHLRKFARKLSVQVQQWIHSRQRQAYM